jgi:hypothetical protein
MASSVATPCAAHKSMYEDWCLIDHLRGGTRAMRIAGPVYLPKRPLEEESDYRSRLCSATLLPAFTETSKTMVGRVFSEPMQIGEDVPGWIKDEVIPDVDRQGRSLEVFVSDWFHEALDYGISHVIVENPVTTDVQTRAEQKAQSVRPYCIRIHPRDVLGWQVDENGKLIQLRVRYCRTEQDLDGFEMAVNEEIRVYEANKVRVFEEIDGKPGEYEETQTIETSFTEIPIVTLYTKRTGFMMAEPPLRELAFLNSKHWRLQADIDELVDVAQVPILLMTGVNEGDQIIIGARHAVRLSTHDADLKYVEHTGAATKVGMDRLTGIVDEMKQAGARLLEHDIAKTESQANEDAMRDNCDLGRMTRTLQDTVGQLLDVIASSRGTAKGGTVKLTPNLNVALDPNTIVATALDLYHESIISKQSVFEISQEVGVLPDNLEWEDEQTRVKEEPPPMPAAPVVVPAEKKPPRQNLSQAA